MTKLKLLICLLVLLIFTGPLHAQQREVLFKNYSSPEMQKLVNSLLNPHYPQVGLGQFPVPKHYFVRITERQFVIGDDKKFNPDATLASSARVFAFLTTPEGFFGKSLVQIFGDIGYEAEDMIANQSDKEMVVMLFRYRDDISVSEVKNGNFGADWRNGIYSTTWDNMFGLFSRLVEDQNSAACKQQPRPALYICLASGDRDLVMRFSPAQKQQLREQTYQALKAKAGMSNASDQDKRLWQYRALLERNLSMFEHFRGDGYTENEIVDLQLGIDSDRRLESGRRLPEVVGPNKKLSDLKELAVISLGRMIVEDRNCPACVR